MTIDLEKSSSLPIKFKDGKLILTKEIALSSIAGRKIKELESYLYGGKTNKSLASKNAYVMYRGVCLKKDKDLFENNHLRYDITTIFPYQFKKEFNKTIGHCHKTPEIYEVLSGEALVLLQEPGASAEKIYLERIKPPFKIIIPAFYNHLIINPSKQTLIVADLFSNQVQSDYSILKNKYGAGYYVLSNGNIKNPHYKTVGKLNINKLPKNSPSQLRFKKPIYQEFTNNPEKFEFLN
ncbi:MAG: glucose-6-phosphate isomerase family protein [Candidatus Paceibacterota bacterium]|jgi:glucose-6-phosphate isomerase